MAVYFSQYGVVAHTQFPLSQLRIALYNDPVFNSASYHIDRSVLLENTPLVKLKVCYR